MKLKTVKTAREIERALREFAVNRDQRPLVEVNTVDKTVKSVRIGAAHIAIDSYSLVVSVESPFEEAHRTRVTATVAGFPPDVSYFENYEDADAKKRQYGEGVDAVLETNVAVLIDAQGNVVREGTLNDQPAPASIDDDCPF